MTAASPSLRTRSRISRTCPATDSPSGIRARMWAAAPAAPPRPERSCALRRSRRMTSGPAGHSGSERVRANRGRRAGALTQPGEQLVDLPGLKLVGDRVCDQPGGAHDDLLADDQVVLAQGGASGGQVDDRLDHACQRRELDRALDLDDLCLPAGLLPVARSDD